MGTPSVGTTGSVTGGGGGGGGGDDLVDAFCDSVKALTTHPDFALLQGLKVRIVATDPNTNRTMEVTL